MIWLKYLITLVIIQAKITLAYECYVCSNQVDNNEKCIKTVKTCDLSENNCMTTVRWGSTPYWDPKGQKQYYISKECASSLQCEFARANTSRRCDRIWYNDWECVECCFGDRCNYYVTLGSHTANANFVLLSLAATIATICINFSKVFTL